MTRPGIIPEVKEKKDKKVAIVGAGPAGLTAAYYLAIEGYDVDVFEALPVAGGWLAVGIPEYRLPKDVLKAEIKVIEDLGVKIHLNTAIGKDIPFEKLRKDYDAVFIGCGTVLSSKLDIPGEELQGVVHGVDYLQARSIWARRSSWATASPSSAAGTSPWTPSGPPSARARRMFSSSTAAPARRCPHPPRRSKRPSKRGSRWNSWWPRSALSAKDGKLTGIECLRMELGEPDASGRRRPVPIKGSEFIDRLRRSHPGHRPGGGPRLRAEGKRHRHQQVEQLRRRSGDLRRRTFPASSPAATSSPVPATVVKAVFAGKEAAVSIDRYLKGEDLAAGRAKDWTKDLADKGDISEGGQGAPGQLSAPEAGRAEKRLPGSGDRLQRGGGRPGGEPLSRLRHLLRMLPVRRGLYRRGRSTMTMTVAEEDIDVGAIIAAPGFEVFDAGLRGEYGFGDLRRTS